MFKVRTLEPRIGLALSGGGALGMAHIGALQALQEHHVPLHCIAGTSAGAIVAAAVAFDIPLAEVAQRARKVTWRTIARPTLPRMGLVRNDALRTILAPYFDGACIEEAHIPLAIVATDLTRAERVVLKSGSIIDALLASTCLPGFFAPVVDGERLLVDGGVAENFPVSVLGELGADIKIGVNVNRWIADGRPRHLFGVISKTLAIMNAHPHLPHENEIFIEPRLATYSVSDFAKAEQLIALGYREAVLRMDDVHALIAQWTARPSLRTRIREFLLRTI